MKKISTLILMLLLMLGLASCSIFNKENENKPNINRSKIEKVEEKTKPEFSAYSRVENENKNGYYKFYFFNCGSVRGIPIQMGRTYQYSNGVPITVSYTSEKTTEKGIEKSIENGITSTTELSIQKGQSIVRGKQNTNTKTQDFTLESSLSANIENSYTVGTEAEANVFFGSATAKAELTQTVGVTVGLTATKNWGEEFSKTNSVEQAKSYDETCTKSQETNITNAVTTCNTFIETNSITESFTLDNVEEGFYRYGLLSLCDVYCVLAIDTANKSAYVTYNLYPIKDKFYYGIQYSKDMNFDESLSSKFNVDLSDIIPYLNYDADNSIQIYKYTVTFNTNGGSTIPEVVVASGNKISKPTNPIKNGYIFKGWYKESSLINEYNFNDYVTKNITLYAKWEKQHTQEQVAKYKVQFETYCDTHITPQIVESGGYVSKPSNPIRAGYKFKGWYTDSSYTCQFDFNSKITADTIVYAKWEKVDNFNPNSFSFKLYNWYCSRKSLQFQYSLANNTGVTIYGVKNATIKVYVNGTLRANGFFSYINCGTIYNNSSHTGYITFASGDFDYNFWANIKSASMSVSISCDFER